jgi:hypothetical protein
LGDSEVLADVIADLVFSVAEIGCMIQ